jgi:hypothetical protein
MKKSILFLTTVIMITACCKKIENPFFVEWDTPYGLPPFEQIEEKHFLPAIEEGIKQQQAEVSAIINSLEAPTFENTIEAYDHSGALLSKVIGVLFNLSESATVTAGRPCCSLIPTGIPRPLSRTVIISPGRISTSIWVQKPANASSIELSTIS